MPVKETALSKLILIAVLAFAGTGCSLFDSEGPIEGSQKSPADMAAINKANRLMLADSEEITQPREVGNADSKSVLDLVKRNKSATLYHLRPQYKNKISAERLRKIQQYGLAGDGDACYLLGIAYKYGRGVPQNRQLAYDWLERASKIGHFQAKQTLTHMYNSGF
jgi:TPR repeat protein